ncbi:hypothetical protein KUL42_18030 [Alteromonas sp. KUL42]|uniref:glycosyltransferase family 4 protein n=1 Tax=Alteromonas sp. KUL42 TaxID=2480797 RepID=UPI0010356FE1|nr:glycosyltransferase family 4 protein [Alteromonas sp. KUL42]TAP35566.1 glycosyltransferase [Alteromonas sp. KUL42]GEA07042.1 hypothetical protein KUL42_18030 [Alteromonas sp. KUL42]
MSSTSKALPTRPMKIIMLCDFYNENLEYQENLLTKYYTKYGHDVTVICSTYESVFDYYSGKHNKNIPAKTYYDGKAKIIKLRYSWNIMNKLRRYTSIKRILEQEKPDLIYVHDVMFNMLEATSYMKKHPSVRMIMDYHADYSNSARNWLSLKVLHGLLRKWCLDKARPYISCIFPIVPGSKKFLHEVYKVPLSEMEVLPLGADVDLGRLARQSLNLANLRKAYNHTKDTKLIFTGGKLEPRKQTELLIDAVDSLRRNDVRLVIIGQSAQDDKGYYQMLKNKAKDNPYIYFAGWQDKVGVYEHLAIADIAVFPASQSILWQQAISMGLPLVCGNTGEQSIEYLNLHGNIVIHQAKEISVDSYRHSLEKLLDDETALKRMGEGAKKVSETSLDWNNLINRTLRYNTALEK